MSIIYKPTDKKNTKIKIHKKPVVRYNFYNKKNIYTNKNILYTANKLSQKFKKENINVSIQVLIKTNNKIKPWKSSKILEAGKKISVVESNEYANVIYEEPKYKQTSFNQFIIYVKPGGTKTGGLDDSSNDCLYKCLQIAVNPKHLPWKSAETFKKFIGVKRNDPIPITALDGIEKRLSAYKINLHGDYSKISSKSEANYEIDLNLQNGHFSICKTPAKYGIYRTSAVEEKLIIIYQKISHNVFKIIDVEKKQCKKITLQQFKDLDTFHYHIIHCVNNTNIMKFYTEYLTTANLLKAETNGKINLYEDGSYKNTALNLFYSFIDAKKISADHIDQHEALWIEEASCGAIIHATKYTGPAWKYDVCSQYPYIMSDRYMNFPIRKGVFKIITPEEFNNLKCYSYGIYHCKIKKPANTPALKYRFRFNYHNKYTHNDLTTAKDLGLNVSIINDGNVNCLLYTGKLINGTALFGEYVNLLFALKQKIGDPAKKILNILWGALVEKKCFDLYNDDNEKDDLEIKPNKEVLGFLPMSDTKTKVTLCNPSYYYKTNFARIKPFLLAKGRYKIGNIVKEHIDNIVYCHTDGFISNKKLDLKTGNNLGDLKYEGCCENFMIKNVNKKTPNRDPETDKLNFII